MTIEELDKWIKDNPQTDRWGHKYLPSRYEALKLLVGVYKADKIMRELEVASW